jgi:hypothetical protein
MMDYIKLAGPIFPALLSIIIGLLLSRERFIRYPPLKGMYPLFFFSLFLFFSVDLISTLAPDLSAQMWDLKIFSFLLSAIMVGNIVTLPKYPAASTIKEYLKEFRDAPNPSSLIFMFFMAVGIIILIIFDGYESFQGLIPQLSPFFLFNIAPIILLAMLFPPAIHLKRCYELRSSVGGKCWMRIRLTAFSWVFFCVSLIIFTVLSYAINSVVLYYLGYVVSVMPFWSLLVPFRD